MKKTASMFVLLALAACAGGDKPEQTPMETAPAPPPEVKIENLICPQVAIVREAEEEVDYGGEKPNDAQFIAKARFKKIEGDCGYRKDEDDKAGIDIAFTAKALAARGPKLGGDRVSFPYFVALVDPAEKILSRQIMTAEFRFSGDKKVSEIDEPLHVFIPLHVKDFASGPDYRVLIGFKKTAH